MMKLSLMNKWRWWWMLAGAALLVVRRLQRKPPSVKQTVFPEDKPTPAQAAVQRARADKALRDIFALAHRFLSTREAHTLADREGCLLRAAEMILGSTSAAVPFFAMHRDVFLVTSQETSREPDCEKCGARMQEGSSHDEALDEWMPAWTCARCGAQVPR